MSWQKELEQFASDIFWVLMIIVTTVAIVVGGIWVWKHATYSPFNENKVLHSFVNGQLKQCKEKLGAYGETVDFESNDVSAEVFIICIEKLSIYEDVANLQ